MQHFVFAHNSEYLPGYVCREPGKPPRGDGPEEPEKEDLPEATTAGRKLVCAACRQYVTTTSARIEVSGQHRHVFFNPYGMVFDLGCFSQAPGAIPRGQPSTEFAWFPGHVWQITVCAHCRLHLGWRFTSGDSGFYGLIVSNLVEEPED
jgi:hypothetical protein